MYLRQLTAYEHFRCVNMRTITITINDFPKRVVILMKLETADSANLYHVSFTSKYILGMTMTMTF